MMSRFIKDIILFATAFGIVTSASGFVLFGPNADWMIERVGFDPPQIGGGPVNLGEEYRWNLPQITYGFSPTFVSYFGQKGVDEIEKALDEFRNLPPFETINPNNYPLKSERVNHRAQELGLLDLKSVTMGMLIQQMGVGDPIGYMHVLRKRYIIAQTTNYVAIRRNFDPIDHHITSFVNGDLYAWTGLTDGDTATFLTTTSVDPLIFGGGPVSTRGALLSGIFYDGFTRDDIGGLKYIYRRSNINVEELVTGATNAAGFGGGGVPLAGTGGGLVNTIGGVSGGGTGNPWGTPLFPIATNQVVGGVATVNTNIANQGLRQGLNDFNFVRLDFDSLIGAFTQRNVSYTDTVQTNEFQGSFSQTVSRTLTQPDILFHADNNAGGATDNFIATIVETAPGTRSTGTSHFRFVDALGTLGVNQNDQRDGPGIIDPPLVFTYSDLGISWQGIAPNFTSEFNGARDVLWATFDGTTNAPVVYPFRPSIEEIENAVRGRF